MGPYGSVWAHIKTGRSPMAHDHFQTPPNPQKGFYNPIWVLFWMFVTENVSMIWNVNVPGPDLTYIHDP